MTLTLQSSVKEVLKDKLRHLNILKSLFEQKMIQVGQHQTGSGEERHWERLSEKMLPQSRERI